VQPAGTPPPLQRHGFDVAPPPSIASPHGISFDDGQEMWWKPTWGEIWHHLGYRRLLFLPLVGLIFLIGLVVFDLRYIRYVWLIGIKWIVMLVAIPFGLASYGVAGVTRKRTDLFCIHCGYSLVGLPDLAICPECGRRYSFAQSEEYRRDPAWFIQRWRARQPFPPAHGQITAGQVRSARRKDGT
jgi:hypothetical protein